MQKILLSLTYLRCDPKTVSARLAMINEAERYGLEGRSLYINHFTPLNTRMLPGFPNIPGTLDLDVLHQSASSWVNFHMYGG